MVQVQKYMLVAPGAHTRRSVSMRASSRVRLQWDAMVSRMLTLVYAGCDTRRIWGRALRKREFLHTLSNRRQRLRPRRRSRRRQRRPQHRRQRLRPHGRKRCQRIVIRLLVQVQRMVQVQKYMLVAPGAHTRRSVSMRASSRVRLQWDAMVSRMLTLVYAGCDTRRIWGRALRKREFLHTLSNRRQRLPQRDFGAC